MNKDLIIQLLETISSELNNLGGRLYSKFGTESYEERCMNYNIRDAVIKITEQIKISALESETEPPKEIKKGE